MDSEGFSATVFEGLADFEKDEKAVSKADKCHITRKGEDFTKQWLG